MRCKSVSVFFIALAFGLPVHADIALDVENPPGWTVFPAGGSIHGWAFEVSAPLLVTHLGLYDSMQDGFGAEHPVGLWNSHGDLLAAVTMQAGTSDPLIDWFRFAPVSGLAPQLDPGETYTLGFYTEAGFGNDYMEVLDGFYSIHSLVTQIGAGLSLGGQSQLSMPTTPDPNGAQRIGPNFMFTNVPGPPAVGLMLLGLLGPARRRSNGSWPLC